MYLCIYVSMYLCIYISMYLCIYVSIYLCIYVSMHLSMYVCMYVCIYVCMYVCMCIYIDICVCVGSKFKTCLRCCKNLIFRTPNFQLRIRPNHRRLRLGWCQWTPTQSRCSTHCRTMTVSCLTKVEDMGWIGLFPYFMIMDNMYVYMYVYVYINYIYTYKCINVQMYDVICVHYCCCKESFDCCMENHWKITGHS